MANVEATGVYDSDRVVETAVVTAIRRDAPTFADVAQLVGGRATTLGAQRC